MDNDMIRKLTRDLNRCLSLLKGVEETNEYGRLSLGFTGFVDMQSWDFDREVEKHLYPYVREFLKIRAKTLSEELAKLIK